MMTITFNKKDVNLVKECLLPVYELVGESYDFAEAFEKFFEEWDEENLTIHTNAANIFTKDDDLIIQISEEYAVKYLQFIAKYSTLIIPHILGIISVTKSMMTDSEELAKWSIQSTETEQEKKIKDLKSEIKAEESNFSNIMNIITDLEDHNCNDMAKELEKTKAKEINKRIADLKKQLQDVKSGKDKKSSKEETNFNEVKDDVKTTEETSFKEV